VIHVRTEQARGCGFRKPGGLYLVTDGPGVPCALMPLELHVCTACGRGVKPSRGWTWIEPAGVFGEALHEHGEPTCPLSSPTGLGPRAGLLWVGAKFYRTPGEFTDEARRMGISRRISTVPRGFTLGQWVLLAHRAALECESCYGTGDDDGEAVGNPRARCRPCHGVGGEQGVFHVFRPQRIEYVVRESDTEKKLAHLERRGITLVKVLRGFEQLEIEREA
jgi:hypothetical protein